MIFPSSRRLNAGEAAAEDATLGGLDDELALRCLATPSGGIRGEMTGAMHTSMKSAISNRRYCRILYGVVHDDRRAYDQETRLGCS